MLLIMNSSLVNSRCGLWSTPSCAFPNISRCNQHNVISLLFSLYDVCSSSLQAPQQHHSNTRAWNSFHRKYFSAMSKLKLRNRLDLFVPVEGARDQLATTSISISSIHFASISVLSMQVLVIIICSISYHKQQSI